MCLTHLGRDIEPGGVAVSMRTHIVPRLPKTNMCKHGHLITSPLNFTQAYYFKKMCLRSGTTRKEPPTWDEVFYHPEA